MAATDRNGNVESSGPVAPTVTDQGRPGLRRALIALAVLVGLGLFVFAGLLADTDESDKVIPVTGGAVESLIPAQDAAVLQQQTVAIDLATGWDGDLSINNVSIPSDQLNRNEGLSTIGFQPGPGKVIEALGPGQNCATSNIFKVSEGPGGSSAQTVTWCFEAT